MRIVFVALTLCFVAMLSQASAAEGVFDGRLDLFCSGKHHVYNHLPQFKDFPAENLSKQAAKDVDFSSFKGSRKYRTYLRDGLKEGPDFDGHYKVVVYGCGTGCQGNWVVDTASGQVLGTFETSYGVTYRKDSALLIANLPDGGCDTVPPIDRVEFYAVRHGKLVTVKRLDVAALWRN